MAGWTFLPASRAYTNATGDWPGQDYTAVVDDGQQHVGVFDRRVLEGRQRHHQAAALQRGLVDQGREQGTGRHRAWVASGASCGKGASKSAITGAHLGDNPLPPCGSHDHDPSSATLGHDQPGDHQA
jgi:hypothetical protein